MAHLIPNGRGSKGQEPVAERDASLAGSFRGRPRTGEIAWPSAVEKSPIHRQSGTTSVHFLGPSTTATYGWHLALPWQNNVLEPFFQDQNLCLSNVFVILCTPALKPLKSGSMKGLQTEDGTAKWPLIYLLSIYSFSIPNQ